MEPRVEVVEGTAFEVLVGAAAIADPAWCEVFASGPAVHEQALAVGGPAFVQAVADVGRYGWINLMGLLTDGSEPQGLDQLISVVRDRAPDDLHYVAVGGDREQLVAAVDEPVIRAALAGDLRARRQLGSAFASDENVLGTTPWLFASGSAEVREVVLDVLRTWRTLLLPPAKEAALAVLLHEHALVARAELARTTGRDFLADTVGGLHYDPASLDRLLMVSSPGVVPIVVVVDGRSARVVLHPPVRAPEGETEPSARLLELSRALGDRTRLALLTRLRDGEMTAVELARAMQAPRTTLLHHLAILRSAGLVHVEVTPGGATVYRLRSQGFTELSESTTRFLAEHRGVE